MKALLALSSLGLVASAAFALPNPAAVQCGNLGGTVLILNGSAGQAGFCQLGRAMIEEWTLDRATTGYGCQLAVTTYLTHPAGSSPGATPSGAELPNPASAYCAAVGGTSVNYTDASGNAYGICQFSDNSSIDEWTLYRGPNDSTNSALTSAVKTQCSVLTASGRGL